MRPTPVRLALALLLVFALPTALVGCQTTSVTTVWESPDPKPEHPFQRVIVVVSNATPADRRAGEDALVEAIHRFQAVASYTIVPDADMTNREAIRKIVHEQGFDGAIVVRLVSADKQTSYYPPSRVDSYSTPYGYTGPSGFYGIVNYPTYTPGYTVTDTIYRAEVSIYSVPEDRLLWAGSSTTDNPNGIADLIRQIAKGTAEELRRRGLIS